MEINGGLLDLNWTEFLLFIKFQDIKILKYENRTIHTNMKH